MREGQRGLSIGPIELERGKKRKRKKERKKKKEKNIKPSGSPFGSLEPKGKKKKRMREG